MRERIGLVFLLSCLVLQLLVLDSHLLDLLIGIDDDLVQLSNLDEAQRDALQTDARAGSR